MPTIQEATQQAQDLVNSLLPDTITYRSVVLTLSLDPHCPEGQVQCRVYLCEGGALTRYHETFKASSLSRLLGKMKTELEDVFHPLPLEEFILAA